MTFFHEREFCRDFVARVRREFKHDLGSRRHATQSKRHDFTEGRRVDFKVGIATEARDRYLTRERRENNVMKFDGQIDIVRQTCFILKLDLDRTH